MSLPSSAGCGTRKDVLKTSWLHHHRIGISRISGAGSGGIALDQRQHVGRGKMYWTIRRQRCGLSASGTGRTSSTGKIQRAQLGWLQCRRTLTSSPLGVMDHHHRIDYIALDVGRGKMYWTTRARIRFSVPTHSKTSRIELSMGHRRQFSVPTWMAPMSKTSSPQD